MKKSLAMLTAPLVAAHYNSVLWKALLKINYTIALAK